MANRRQEELYADSEADDARAAANRSSKGGRVFHAPGDTNLFGGSFTPFKDIWNAAAADLGITTKRMRNDALETAASEEAVWRDTSEALHNSIAESRGAATNPADLKQLRTLDTQLSAARRMTQSANPKLQEQGYNLLGKITDSQRAFDERQEVQQIAKDTHDEQMRNELGATRWSRFNSAYDDLHRESSNFLTVQGSYRALQSAYAVDGEPGNANDIAALNSIQRMIDPGVSVREGDVALLQNLAGVPDILITAANRVAKGGGRFTPAERKELLELGRQLMGGANEQQAQTNVRFQGMGQAAELPDSYVGKLMIPLVDTGGENRLNFGKDATIGGGGDGGAEPTGEETPASVMRDTAVGVGDLYQGARHGVTNVLEGLNARPWEAPYKRGNGLVPISPVDVSGTGPRIMRRPTND